MKHIVIAGAGPIGLFTAIKLKQMGVTNVTVADPRAGLYKRPGNIDSFEDIAEKISTKQTKFEFLQSSLPSKEIEKINQKLMTKLTENPNGKFQFLYSSSAHIKEAERILFGIAKAFGVIVETKQFIDFKMVEAKDTAHVVKQKGI